MNKVEVFYDILHKFAADEASPNRQRSAVADDSEGQGGSINIDGIQRLKTPFVRAAKGKGRFLNVTVCGSQTSQF